MDNSWYAAVATSEWIFFGMTRQPSTVLPDLGYAARFLSIYAALGFFRFDGESTLPPTAANAGRSAADAGS